MQRAETLEAYNPWQRPLEPKPPEFSEEFSCAPVCRRACA